MVRMLEIAEMQSRGRGDGLVVRMLEIAEINQGTHYTEECEEEEGAQAAMDCLISLTYTCQGLLGKVCGAKGYSLIVHAVCQWIDTVIVLACVWVAR